MFFDRQSRIFNFLLRPKKSKLKNIRPTAKSWEQNLELSNCSLLLNRMSNPVSCKGVELDDVFFIVGREFLTFSKTRKIEIEKYWSYNIVVGTKLVALELLITIQKKAEPCKLQGRGARCTFFF